MSTLYDVLELLLSLQYKRCMAEHVIQTDIKFAIILLLDLLLKSG